MVEVEVGAVEAGKKVHRLIRQLLPGVPLSGVYKMIRTGRVKHNGKRAKSEDVVQQGDVIRLYMSEEDFELVRKSEKKFAGLRGTVDVIYEDASLLVVNKPLGLLTHGAEGEHKETLANYVLAYLYHKDELKSSIFTPSPANRLDRNTSGIVMFGKTGDAARTLADAFAKQGIRKWYVAIVRGTVSEPGEISARLERTNGIRTNVAHSGREAVTRYEPIVHRGRTSVVKIELIHGRTHQIRAHFSHIDHALYGDVKYGGSAPSETDVNHTQWLHAKSIQLADGQSFHAPLPELFKNTLRELGYTDVDIRKIEQA